MSADESGKRPTLTDDQRERIDGAVRRVCVELDRETTQLVHDFVRAYKAEQRGEHLFAIGVRAFLVLLIVAVVAIVAYRIGGAS